MDAPNALGLCRSSDNGYVIIWPTNGGERLPAPHYRRVSATSPIIGPNYDYLALTAAQADSRPAIISARASRNLAGPSPRNSSWVRPKPYVTGNTLGAAYGQQSFVFAVVVGVELDVPPSSTRTASGPMRHPAGRSMTSRHDDESPAWGDRAEHHQASTLKTRRLKVATRMADPVMMGGSSIDKILETTSGFAFPPARSRQCWHIVHPRTDDSRPQGTDRADAAQRF